MCVDCIWVPVPQLAILLLFVILLPCELIRGTTHVCIHLVLSAVILHHSRTYWVHYARVQILIIVEHFWVFIIYDRFSFDLLLFNFRLPNIRLFYFSSAFLFWIFITFFLTRIYIFVWNVLEMGFVFLKLETQLALMWTNAINDALSLIALVRL